MRRERRSRMLIRSIQKNSPHLLLDLISRGADVNYETEEGAWTPLYYAMSRGFLECGAILIDSGANLMHQDKYKVTPLHVAMANGHLQCGVYLCEKGAAIDHEDVYGYTELHRAIFNGHEECAAFLLTRGAKINQVTSNLDLLTPLHLAMIRAKERCVSLLLSRGVDDAIKDAKGNLARELGPLSKEYSAMKNKIINSQLEIVIMLFHCVSKVSICTCSCASTSASAPFAASSSSQSLLSPSVPLHTPGLDDCSVVTHGDRVMAGLELEHTGKDGDENNGNRSNMAGDTVGDRGCSIALVENRRGDSPPLRGITNLDDMTNVLTEVVSFLDCF